MNYFYFLPQVSVSPHAWQTNDALDNLSNVVKNAGRTFASCWLKPKRNRTVSEGSALEDDIFQPPLKMTETVNTNRIQTCSLHTPSQGDKPAASLDNLRYEAESPDEAALVYAAKAYGFTLLARTPDSVTVRLPSGEDLAFEVLDILTFDSNRKRMSVLVRHPITKECVLYTKGADSAIMELLGTPCAGICKEHINISVHYSKCNKYNCILLFAEHLRTNQKNIAADTQHHLDCYAKEGLRTLCITKKVQHLM